LAATRPESTTANRRVGARIGVAGLGPETASGGLRDVGELLQGICRQSYALLLFLFRGAGNTVDRTTLWTAAIVLVTALAALFGLIQLRNIRCTSRADFTKRFIDSFFVADTRTLFTLLLNSALEFDIQKIVIDGREIDELPYLRIKKEIVEQLKGIVPFDPLKTGYSPFEIDDFLLGPFEDVGWYVRRKLIDLTTADQGFGYYMIETLEHAEMKKFLEHQRKHEFSYDDLEWLYKKFKARQT
jgi:hypothetical protein